MSFKEFVKTHKLAVLLAVPFIMYGGSKAIVPHREQCDFRPADVEQIMDGWVNYYRYDGTNSVTNLLVACCGGVVTNELCFSKGGFYFEQSLYPAVDKSNHGIWFRDSQTNEWAGAVIDEWADDIAGVEWRSGWLGAIAHIEGYADPKDYRFWFFGSRENLPERVIEGGVGIEIVRGIRTSKSMTVEFRRTDPAIATNSVTLSVRFVNKVDGVKILGDWENLASTTDNVITVMGDFVSRHNEIRLYADKGVAQ